MSHKKAKGIKNHPSAEPDHKRGEEKSSNRHVYIEPGAKIDFVEDLRQKYDANQDEDKTHRADQLFWTKVASGLLVFTTLFTAWQGCSTYNVMQIAQKTYDASERPYIGEDSVMLSNVWRDKDGVEKASQIPTRDSVAFAIQANIKNFGPIPGSNFSPSWKVLINGKEPPSTPPLPEVPSTLFPNQVVVFGGNIGGPDYYAIVSGRETLEVEVRASYDGPTGHHYQYCSKAQYDHNSGHLARVGDCSK